MYLHLLYLAVLKCFRARNERAAGVVEPKLQLFDGLLSIGINVAFKDVGYRKDDWCPHVVSAKVSNDKLHSSGC